MPGGIAASRAILASGNVITDVASGNIPSFNNFGDVASYAGGTAFNAFTTAGASKALGKLAEQGLKNVALRTAKEAGTETVLAGLGGTSSASGALNVYGIPTPISQEIFLTAAEGAIEVGVSAQAVKWGEKSVGLLSLGVTTSGAFTEPTLPNKTLANQNGVTIEHYYKSNDHGSAHAHVKGQGPNTTIGPNGHPTHGNPPMSPAQRKVYNNNKSSIRRKINKIGKWLKYFRK